jgi:hypothetical protein
MTPSGIEPATVRFVAQHFNHCANAVPYYYTIKNRILMSLFDQNWDPRSEHDYYKFICGIWVY